jgi:hypothetical protein
MLATSTCRTSSRVLQQPRWLVDPSPSGHTPGWTRLLFARSSCLERPARSKGDTLPSQLHFTASIYIKIDAVKREAALAVSVAKRVPHLIAKLGGIL